MLPGFVDSHGHVVLGGLQALAANLLAPPDGDVNDIPGLVERGDDEDRLHSAPAPTWARRIRTEAARSASAAATARGAASRT